MIYTHVMEKAAARVMSPLDAIGDCTRLPDLAILPRPTCRASLTP